MGQRCFISSSTVLQYLLVKMVEFCQLAPDIPLDVNCPLFLESSERRVTPPSPVLSARYSLASRTELAWSNEHPNISAFLPRNTELLAV